MAVKSCPHRALSTASTLQAQMCRRELCEIWNEQLQMCSHKATALLLVDIHNVIINLGIKNEIITLPEEEKKSEEEGG
jgi:hypothetical protein